MDLERHRALNGPRLAGVVLLFALLSNAFAQFHRIGPEPSWVEPIEADLSALFDTACTGGGEAFLLQDRQIDLNSSAFYFRLVTRLTNSEGVQNGSRVTVKVDPSYQALTIHHVEVIRGNKVVRRLAAKDITVLQQEADLGQFLYDGSRTVVIELDGVRSGDVIDQAYTIVGANPAYGGRINQDQEMGYGVSLAHNRLRLVIPKGREIDHRAWRYDVPREVTAAGDHEVWTWEEREVPCIRGEYGTPGWYWTYPALEFSEYRDVEDLRRWAIDLYDVDVSLDAELREVVEKLRGVTDPLQRIDSAIHIVQREVRYLGLEQGISAYEPHPPAKVFAQRFGDCKDRSLLLATLLNAIGVDAWPALVNSRGGDDLEDHLPGPGMFDHCIVMMEHDGKPYWLDPTRTHSAGTFEKRYAPDLGRALVLDPNRTGWTRMRVDHRGTADVREQFTLDSIGGGADLVVASVYTGSQADRQRSALAGSSLVKVGKDYLDFYQRLYGEATMTAPLSVEDDLEGNTLSITESYRLLDIWDRDSSGLWTLEVDPSFLRGYVVTSDTRYRTTPLYLGSKVSVKQRITMKMPDDWAVDLPTEEYSGFGVSFTKKQWSVGDSVYLDYVYTSDSSIVAPEDSPEFHDQQDRILNSLGVVLSQHENSDLVASRKRWSIAAVVLFILLTLFGIWHVYRYDPPAADGYGSGTMTGIGGWMVLPLIGLILAPFIQLADIFDADTDFLMLPVHASLSAVSDPSLYQLYCYYAQAFSIAMVGLTMSTLVLFFQRRTSVPMLMIILYAANFVNLFLDRMVFGWFDLEALTGTVYGDKDLVRSFLAAVIWIPFFLVSVRVKTTFKNRRMPLQVQA